MLLKTRAGLCGMSAEAPFPSRRFRHLRQGGAQDSFSLLGAMHIHKSLQGWQLVCLTTFGRLAHVLVAYISSCEGS